MLTYCEQCGHHYNTAIVAGHHCDPGRSVSTLGDLQAELQRRVAEAERMETKTNVLLRNAILDVKEWYGRRWPLVLLRAIWETR